MDTLWDCVVAGGGAAGLSAALVLGRATRATLVIDAGRPSNAVAHGIGGLLGHDGRPPADLYAAGRAEVESYPRVQVRSGSVVEVHRGEAFTVRLADGAAVRTRRLLLATGMDYRLPDIPGLAERWGAEVFHCPFCHGWEMRGAPLGVLARGSRAVHAGLMLRGWTDDIVVLTDGEDGLADGDIALLAAAGIPVDRRRISGVRGAGSGLAVVFADGAELVRAGVMVGVELAQRSTLADQLGVRLNESNPLSAEGIWVDDLGRTSVPGVFAAGDATVQLPQVAAAIAAGSKAAASVVASLLAEEYGLPLPAWPESKEDARV
jgi:thioredoxin reductase (NADPH)